MTRLDPPRPSRTDALGLLGLRGTGRLYPRTLGGTLRIRRGGVCLSIDRPRRAKEPVR